MNRSLIRFFSWSVILTLVASCEQPLDPVIKSVDNANSILRQYDWQLSQFQVKVKRNDLPPPLLLNTNDSLIRSGIYGLEDMILDGPEMRTYRVNFTRDGQIFSSGGQLDVLAVDNKGSYFVINERSVRISNSQAKLNYGYYYDQNDQVISLTLDEERAEKVIRDINDKLIKNVANRTPTKIGNVVANVLFNNQALQRYINDVVVSAIAGKLSFINEIDPDEAARILAGEIFNALGQVDWEDKLAELLQAELEKLSNIDADRVSEEISRAIAEFVNDKLSEDRIYDLILPYIEQIPVNAELVSESIATLIVNLFLDTFDEGDLQAVVAGAWRKFTKLDEEQIGTLADTLAFFVQDVWINQENLSNLLLPLTQRIDETSILKMGELAAEATDALRVFIDNINGLFPELNLDPDYNSIQPVIRAAFIAAKPVIGLVGGPEKAATELAGTLINQFLNKEVISGAFVAALEYLQSIDPEIVGNVLTQWLLSLEVDIAPALIALLRDLMSPILDNLNPELTALRIASALSSFIEANITPESIKEILTPILEQFKDINAEMVARFLATEILQLDIVKDNVTEDNIRLILTPVLRDIQQTDVEKLAQQLITAIVDSGIFEDVITEDRVSTIISLLIYKASWDNVQIANNFEEAVILLTHD